MVDNPPAFPATRGFDWYRLLPLYWFQNEPTSREWDALLNALLDRFEPKVGYCTATIGPVEVWVENWPYQFGYQYAPRDRRLPMVKTRRRLKRIVGNLPQRDQAGFEIARAALASQVQP